MILSNWNLCKLAELPLLGAPPLRPCSESWMFISIFHLFWDCSGHIHLEWLCNPTVVPVYLLDEFDVKLKCAATRLTSHVNLLGCISFVVLFLIKIGVWGGARVPLVWLNSGLFTVASGLETGDLIIWIPLPFSLGVSCSVGLGLDPLLDHFTVAFSFECIASEINTGDLYLLELPEDSLFAILPLF